MKSITRVLAALVLLGFLGGCAQTGVGTPELAIYESSLSE